MRRKDQKQPGEANLTRPPIRVKITTRDGYVRVVVNPLITDQHNAINEPGVCLVSGIGSSHPGNAVCSVHSIKKLELL